MRSFALGLLVLVLIPACETRTTPSPIEALEVKAAVDSLWSGYAHASDRKDGAAFGALFTDDAALVYSGAPTARGRDAIQTFLVSLYADVDPTGLRIEPEETRVSGPMAIQSGTFEENYIEKGRIDRTRYGRFVLVAEQGKDRAWKIRRLVTIADTIR